MVKVMRSIVVGPLAPSVVEFAAELLGQDGACSGRDSGTLALLLSGHKPYAMFRDYWKYDWVQPIVYYSSGADLVRHFENRVLRVAEGAVESLQERRTRAMLH